MSREVNVSMMVTDDAQELRAVIAITLNPSNGEWSAECTRLGPNPESYEWIAGRLRALADDYELRAMTGGDENDDVLEET